MGNQLSINDFPNELIGYIITESAHDLKSLTLVCRLWRNITLSIPSLWADIKIQNSRDVRRLPLLLARSNSTALNVFIQFTRVEAGIDDPLECDHPIQCHYDGICFRIFTETDIDHIVGLLRIHFPRIKALHLDYRPGHIRWADSPWADGILARFDSPAPILESLQIDSGHGESLPNTFLSRETPQLASAQLIGQSISQGVEDKQFLCQEFPLAVFMFEPMDSIPYSDVIDILTCHSLTITSIDIRFPSKYPTLIPNPLPQFPPLDMPVLKTMTLQGFHFIAGHISAPALDNVALSVQHMEKSIRQADDNAIFHEYHGVVEELFGWLSQHSASIQTLHVSFGHFRKINSLIPSGPLTFCNQLLQNLTSLRISTNIPTDNLAYHFYVPKLENFHYTARMPGGVSFRSIVPWLSHCSASLKSITIRSSQLAAFSTNLIQTPHVKFRSLEYLQVSTPSATFFVEYMCRLAVKLGDHGIRVKDIEVPSPEMPRVRRNYQARE